MPLRVDRKLPLAMFALLLIGAGKPLPDAVPTVGPAADYPVVVGEPFVIEGTTYTPADRLNFDQVGQAMQGSDGGDAISIAHKTLPLPSYAEITALDSGRTILVRVERRGPMRNDRLVELSPGAAAQLGVPGQMQVPIRIRRVNPPEVERAMLRRGERVAERMDTPPGLLVVLRRKLDPQAAAGTLPGAAPAPLPAPIAAPAPKPPVVARNGSPAATVSPAPVVSAKPVPKPAPAAKPAPAPAPKPATPPKAAAAQPAKPAAKSAPAPAAIRAERFVVQVASFSVEANARTAATRTGGKLQSSGRFWRVKLGPFANRAAADAALAKVRAAGYGDARIQRSD